MPQFCSNGLVIVLTGKEKRVSHFLKDMNFNHADLDGCMYGLVSRREGTDETHLLFVTL